MILSPRTSSALQLAAVYTAADVFFNPTREDNYPTVNLEAQACGTPVVTYDVGGCRETLSLPTSRVINASALEVKLSINLDAVRPEWIWGWWKASAGRTYWP